MTPIRDIEPENVGKLSPGLSAKQTILMRGVCGRTLKLPSIWEGVVEITHEDRWLPTVLGKTDRTG